MRPLTVLRPRAPLCVSAPVGSGAFSRADSARCNLIGDLSCAPDRLKGQGCA